MIIRRCALRRQFLDRRKLLFYATLLLILTLIHALLPNNMAAHGMLVGGVFGTLGHWRSTSVSSLVVPANIMSLSRVMHWPAEAGHREAADVSRWIPELPRWARFGSQDVALVGVEGGTLVIGPHYVLKRLLEYAKTRQVVA